MIRALFDRIWPYIAAAGAALGAVLAIRQSGKTAGRREAEIKAQEQRIKNINEAKHVENTINQADDDAVIRRLGEWVRKRK